MYEHEHKKTVYNIIDFLNLLARLAIDKKRYFTKFFLFKFQNKAKMLLCMLSRSARHYMIIQQFFLYIHSIFYPSVQC